MSRLFADRRLAILILLPALLVAAILLLLAAFPYGRLKGTIEERLTARFGRPVTIGSVDRIDTFGFFPTVRLRDIRIPAPAWAGSTDLARIAEAQIAFDALSLLRGRFAARDVSLTGARLSLVRTKDGRESWRQDRQRRGPGGSVLDRLVVHDSQLRYDDAKQGRHFDLAFTSDVTRGLRLTGTGKVRDVPVRIIARAPAIAGGAKGRWPFDVRLGGRGLAMHARGAMAAPLDTDHMELDVTTEAADLKLVDVVIEAGLFRTQPVALAAHVRREPDRWLVDRLTGRIGRSDLTGRLTVAKQDGRTRVEGDLAARQLDFDDLSSDEGLAAAAARERAIGPRVVPDTRVNLAKLGPTDGRVTFRVGRIVSRKGPSSLTSIAGTLTLDRRRLTLEPLTIGMRQGRVTGRAVIDQRDGAPEPLVRLDLRLAGSTIPALAGGGGSVTGRVDARAVLTGRGSTIRAAVGRSSGRIGLAARDGELPAEIAAALGFDAGRALLAGSDDRAVLRCVIVGLAMRNGQGTAGPFVVDTSQSRLDGNGTISFPGETLAIRLTGAPKRDAVLRLPGSATMDGTISQPEIVVPREVKSVGNIFRAIGRTIIGRQGPLASDAACGTLAARVLR